MVLFVSHYLSVVKDMCNRGVLLDNGYISFSGAVSDTIATYVEHSDMVDKDYSYFDYSKSLIDNHGLINILSVKRLSLLDIAMDSEIVISVQLLNHAYTLK